MAAGVRQVGPFQVAPVGFGCMNLSHAYGVPPSVEEGARLLRHARETGYNLFDTAALYGFGKNEMLIGEALAGQRDDFVLASKCGMAANAEGKREINGHPDVIRATCEASLKRLRTDVIDIYYLHRWDKNYPVEDQVGALAELKAAGKIRAIGISEVSVATLRKAHATHPIDAIQSEYSLWTRNADQGMLAATQELGIAFVAFSPVGRGFLSGKLRSNEFAPGDIRRPMPRFIGAAFDANLTLLDGFAVIVAGVGCTMAELAIGWVLARAPHIVALPGTTNAKHIDENWRGQFVDVSADVMQRLDELFVGHVQGNRYPASVRAEIDTEEYAGNE
jgi:aryl-alcohol dehydrogenase-like predicted oxidoreductase